MALDDLLNQLKTNASLIESRREEASQDLLNAGIQHMLQKEAAKAQHHDRSRGSQNNDSGRIGPVHGSMKFGKVDPYADMKTMHFNGMDYTVNETAARRFQSFLRDLRRHGYTPDVSIGGYSDRNIAGTNTKSLHSYGLAIDLDPAQNPVTWNGKNITELPKGVGKLAKKHGLAWGGNWNGSKRDTMHFSVPFFGTK